MSFWKKLNGSRAVPVFKEELVLDQTPTLESTNPVTSDAVARAIAGVQAIPDYDPAEDVGKVLQVTAEGPRWVSLG